jgi:primosomal protein N' (replication factor Y)
LIDQLTPLSAEWLALAEFAADYYHRPVGEVALPSIPKNLRVADANRVQKSLANCLKKTLSTHAVEDSISAAAKAPALKPSPKPTLNPAQAVAFEAISQTQGFATHLLFGITGSGKTEVYLHAVASALQKNPQAQVMILVPEINLTPQLLALFVARFPHEKIAVLHSALADGARLKNWLAAHTGSARIVLGTRLAVLASVPHLSLIMIDEEHDPSFKQQEGLRYSARDLAIWRAHQLRIPIVLGSATPSLETWAQAQKKKYRQLDLPVRAVLQARLPTIKIIDLNQEKPKEGLAPSVLQAIRARLEKGEQSLLFLNRRGYAPVLSCAACGYVCQCGRCSAYMVWHKADACLRCHHCGLESRVPRACSTCGNLDLSTLGHGTQRVEETLQAVFPNARVARIDADSTRKKGSAQAAFAAVHAQEVDILVGTQMVAKGHDFKNLSLVAALNPDSALFSADYRASERLFAQLMQVAGRAGRSENSGQHAEVLIQTRYPDHPLFAALLKHDFQSFARALLSERKSAALPPFTHQAILRAEASKMDEALEFLRASAQIATCALAEHDIEHITVCDAVPMSMARLSDLERAQLLIESPSRPALQKFLKLWLAQVNVLKTKAKWHVEIDPAQI